MGIRISVVAEETKASSCYQVSVQLIESEMVNHAFHHALLLVDHVANNIIQCKLLRICDGVGKTVACGGVEIVSQSDTMSFSNLEDFMLAISIESCPLHGVGFGVFKALINVHRSATMLNA